MFYEDSRYRPVPTHEREEGGRTVRYKGIRFIEDRETRGGHTVRASERLDHIAHRYFEAPDRFWVICDANDALWPPDLTDRPGRTLDIPNP
jgi:hypothetical protein